MCMDSEILCQLDECKKLWDGWVGSCVSCACRLAGGEGSQPELSNLEPATLSSPCLFFFSSFLSPLNYVQNSHLQDARPEGASVRGDERLA